jgi:hypothetical protein
MAYAVRMGYISEASVQFSTQLSSVMQHCHPLRHCDINSKKPVFEPVFESQPIWFNQFRFQPSCPSVAGIALFSLLFFAFKAPTLAFICCREVISGETSANMVAIAAASAAAVARCPGSRVRHSCTILSSGRLSVAATTLAAIALKQAWCAMDRET